MQYSPAQDASAPVLSMKQMERSIRPTAERIPRYQVHNRIKLDQTGVTYSEEDNMKDQVSQAEFNVLKSILNREGYLTRLKQVGRTVGKKFKPEVADVLDLVRAATLDVIENIVRWRELKGDHTAAFMWNGINYLLKMSSDLDYLGDYLAIKKWMGFKLTRNPFCVPFPMEEGALMYPDEITNPKFIARGSTNDGFIIGGLSKSKLQKQYSQGAQQIRKQQEQQHFSSDSNNSSNGAHSRSASFSIAAASTSAASASDFSRTVNTSLRPAVTLRKSLQQGGMKKDGDMSAAQSFILNDDMKKIRQAELVILKEEERFGAFMKDPEGRLMSSLQAITRHAAVELRKDDKRPLTEPSHTTTFAPHAARSDVGLALLSWTPDSNPAAVAAAAGDLEALAASIGVASRRGSAIAKVASNESASGKGPLSKKSTSRVATIRGDEVPYEEADDSLAPRKRGEGKIGGLLAPLSTKGGQTRSQRPLKPTLAGEMEFQRFRHIKSLDQKLAEINRLRAAIEAERNLHSSSTGGSIGAHLMIEDLRGDDTLGADDRGVDMNSKEGVAKSSISNRTHGAKRTKLNYFGALTNDESGGGGLDVGGGVPKSPTANYGGEMKAHKKLQKSSTHAGNLTIDAAAEVEAAASAVAADNSPSTDERGGTKFVRMSTAAASAQSSPKLSRSSTRKLLGQSPVSSPMGSTRKRPALSRGSSATSASQLRLGAAGSSNVDAEEQMRRLEVATALAAKRIEQEQQLKALQHDEILSKQQLNHHILDEENVTKFKDMEKASIAREHSREIERKRRLLTAAEGLRVGPPPEEPSNVYDYYSLKLQRTIRGWLTRCWIRWYRAMSAKASLLLQAAMRGWFGRMRVRRIRLHYNSARIIQKNFRGWLTRGTSSAMAKQRNFAKAAVKVQSWWRGILGVRRVASKRSLDRAAKQAFESVDERIIIVGDVKELALRILYAIEEPSTTEFPPDEVLHLIRLTAMVVQSGRGHLGLTEYDFFNARSYEEVDGENLNWLQAAKMLHRSERFMRLIRIVAYGPGAKPPRLVQLPNNASLLYAALQQNPRWCQETFDQMGMGSKLCSQLFKWLISMIEVVHRQQEFLQLIATSFPDWLPKLHDFQKTTRYCEMEIEMNKKCLLLLDDLRAEYEADESFTTVLDTEVKYVKKEVKDVKFKARDAFHDIDKLKTDQTAREDYALESMELKVAQSTEELEDLAQKYQELNTAAGNGDKAAQNDLPDIRHKLTNQRLKVSELEAQRKLLDMEIESNSAKRKTDARITPDMLIKALRAGEAKAAYIAAQIRRKAMLLSAGVKHAEDLPAHLVDIYERLDRDEQKHRSIARKLYVQGESERQAYDEHLGRAIAASELKEQRARDQMDPSDAELLEERTEDERKAREEKVKHQQYLPDSVLHPAPVRPRPVLLALSRDLSAYSKRRIHQQITKWQPGMYISLSDRDNHGINIHSIQQALDCKKSVILEVDAGLTRVTRNTFLNTLEVTLSTLIPRPFVVLALGDESNRRGGKEAAGAYHGADKSDLQLLKDGDIKRCLEGMHWVIHELRKNEIKMLVQEAAAHVQLPSHSFALVVEALFMLLKQEEQTFNSPDHLLAAMSWRITRVMLVNPLAIADKMASMRRGAASAHAVECLQQYIAHPQWPAEYCAKRSEDIVLHLFAYYVEQYTTCEAAGQCKDGVPLQALAKSSMRGIEAVVTVKDASESIEDADAFAATGGWQMAVAKLLRAVLQDMRVLKSIMRIEPHGLHNVTCYRDCGNVFFEAYHTENSKFFLAVVAVDQLPSLLIPNAYKSSSGTESLVPPQTPLDMYKALCKLLKFESRKDKKDMTLVCRREHTFLGNITRKLNGHTVLLKCFEAALGELCFTGYVPEYSAHVTLLIDEESRNQFRRNADSAEETGERKHADLEDARPLLPFYIDRLRLCPSKPMLLALSKSSSCSGSSSRSSGYTSGYSSSGYINRKQRSGGSHPLSLAAMQRQQGFSLRARVHGGVGRILARRVMRFHQVLHLLEVRSSAPSQVMDIRIYEPRKQHTMFLRMSRFTRLVLFKAVNDDVRSWLPQLLQRLKIDWRGDHSIRCDFSIYKSALVISGRKLILQFHVVDDTCISCELLDPLTSSRFKGSISKDTLIRMLIYQPPEEIVRRRNQPLLQGTEAVVTEQALHDPFAVIARGNTQRTVDSILQQMRRDFDIPESDITPLSHPAVFEKSMEYFIMDRRKLAHLAQQLSMLLEYHNGSNAAMGYSTSVFKGHPVRVLLEPLQQPKVVAKLKQQSDASVGSSFHGGASQTSGSGVVSLKRQQQQQQQQQEVEPINTSLRTDSMFSYLPHAGDFTSTQRARKQQQIVFIEEELNALALEKARQADSKIAADAFAALAVSDYLEAMPAEGTAAIDTAIDDAARSATQDMLRSIHEQLIERFRERDAPGAKQVLFEEQQLVLKQQQQQQVAAEEERQRLLYNPENDAIVGTDWEKVFEAGVKTHYREGKVRWQGHVSVKVYETTAWLGGGDGAGSKLKFVVFEPSSAQSFEGFIRSRKHLREVLGLHGQDLVDAKKRREMLLFVCKYRMDVTVNKKTWDGEDVEEGAPPYRIEFQSDRLFSEDKVTPVNAAEDEDEQANQQKLIDIDNARGKKVVRLVRRINGLLMQLTVFELPQSVAETAYETTKAQILAAAAQQAAAAAAASSLDGTEEKLNSASIERKAAAVDGLVNENDDRSVNSNVVATSSANSGDAKGGSSKSAALTRSNSVEAKATATADPYTATDAAAAISSSEEEMEQQQQQQRKEKEQEEEHEALQESGFAEERSHLQLLTRHPPTAFRIVGYEPRSKRKTTLGVEPQAIIEVAGGVFSPYLCPERRRELAKVVCDALVLIFPAESPFEMLVPWSGAKKDVSTATVGADSKLSQRSGAERVLKRPGRLFRTALRISKYELLVSLYSAAAATAATATAASQVTTGSSSNSSGGIDDNPDNFKLIFNFYSPAVSNAAEVVLNISEQVERIGRPVLKFTEGTVRAAAIRRLCRFFRAEIIEDILDPAKKTLFVSLLPPGKELVTAYQDVKVPPPGADIRPVGVPTVFFPLDTCGRALHRRGMTLQNRDRRSSSHVSSSFSSSAEKDYLVTVYTKTEIENAERGLVVKLYDRSTSQTTVLHVGASELMRICNAADEPDLLRDLVAAQEQQDALTLDDVERGFSDFTAKGQLERQTQALLNRLMDVVLADLGFFISPQNEVLPYIKSAPKGKLPS